MVFVEKALGFLNVRVTAGKFIPKFDKRNFHSTVRLINIRSFSDKLTESDFNTI